MNNVDPEELLGGIDSLVESMDKYTEPLTAKGLAPATFKANLQAVRAELFLRKTERDNQRTALAIAQVRFNESAGTIYRSFSDAVDTVAGALGKRTPEGLQVLGYRKRLAGSTRRPASAHAVAAPVAA